MDLLPIVSDLVLSDLPELPIKIILKYLDKTDPNSIINLSRVCKLFYHATKRQRLLIEIKINSYIHIGIKSIPDSKKKRLTDLFLNLKTCKNYQILKYIYENNIESLEIIIQMGYVFPNSDIYIDPSFLWIVNRSMYTGLKDYHTILDYPDTILDYAILKKKYKMIEMFLKYKPNLDRMNLNGLTPLMYSVQLTKDSDNLKIIELLLKSGADPNIRNDCRKIAIDFISSNRMSDDIKKLLKSYNSEPSKDEQFVPYDYDFDYNYMYGVEVIPQHRRIRVIPYEKSSF